MAARVVNFLPGGGSEPRSPADSGEGGEAASGDGAESTAQTAASGTEQSLALGAVSAYFTNLADSVVNVPPYLGRARVPQVCKHRDKENLLGEIIDLKDALSNSHIHLAEHRHEYVRRLAENRKLERRVEELEQRGNYDAPRSGGVCRLEARAKGLEASLELLSDTVAARKHGELYELSRDLCATRTRETEVERDTFAAEVGRLKMVLQHLKMIFAQAQEENGDWIMCKKHLEKLEALNPKLQQTVERLEKSLEKAKADIKATKSKGKEAASALKKWQSKYESLQGQIQSLGTQVKSAEESKQKRLRKVHQVGFDRMNFNKQFKEENPNVLISSK